MPHCHQDNRLRCGKSISHHSFRCLYGTETQSAQPALFLSDSLEWILEPDVFMPRRGNFAELRVNVSVSPLGLCAGNGRVESVFLCVGSGCGWRVSKSKGSWKSLRRSSIIGEQRTGGGFALFAHTGEL